MSMKANTTKPMDRKTKDQRQRRRGAKGLPPSSYETKQNAHQQVAPESRYTAATNNKTSLSFRPHKTLLVQLTENTPTWYECGRNTSGRDDIIFSVSGSIGNSNHKPHSQQNATLVNKYRSLANLIYEQEMVLSRDNTKLSSDEQWLESAAQKGTLKDRVAAMAVLVRSDPVHKLHTLDKLLQLAGIVSPATSSPPGETSSEVEASNKKNTSSGHFNVRINQMAAEALVDLFINTLLPKHRKLYSLDKRPFYLYEDLAATHSQSPDNHNNNKSNNKNNDNTSRSLSSRILLLWKFEEMLKAKYTAFLVQYLSKALSQNAISSLEHHKIVVIGTASNLLAEIPEGENILLTMIVNKLGDPSRKIAAAAGHRLRLILEAHPNMTVIMAREVQQLAYRPHLTARALYNCIIFLNQLKLTHEDDMDNKLLEKNQLPSSLIKTYFQLFEVAVRKSETLKTGSSSSSPSIKGRLLSALLTGVNRTRPYLSTKNIAMEEHVEALYRIAHTSPPSAATQALLLLFHLSIGSTNDSKSTIKLSSTNNNNSNIGVDNKQDRFYRALYSKLMDPDMYSGRQLTLFFNLLYKSMKCDPDSIRTIAFSKRLLHTATHQNAAVCSGTLFLLSEVGKHRPIIQDCIATYQPDKAMNFDCTKREPKGAFKVSEDAKDTIGVPDSLWELSLCLSHYHPTVVKFAMSMSDINYQGDPLRDITLTHFLDKFAFKNPKSVDKIAKQLKRGESVGEKRSGIEGKLSSLSSTPVNNPEFWSTDKQGANSLSESDEFFKTFFRERAKRDEVKGIVRNKRDEGDDYALDLAEGKEVDFDGNDTDSEEEAFVERLAQQLMDKSGNGKAHYDDEDPDMNDWGDLEEDENDFEEEEIEDVLNDDDDDDDDDHNVDDDNDDHDDDDDNDDGVIEIDDKLDNSDSIDNNVNAEKNDKGSKNTRNGKTNNKNISVFAAAEDYDEIISESISSGKRKMENWKDRASKKKR